MRVPSESTVLRTAAVLWLGAGLLYVAVEAVAAAHIPGYDYAHDYISVLGDARESPLAWQMNATFRVQGAVFVVAGVLALGRCRPRRYRMVFIVSACFYGAGSVVVGLVPDGGGETAATLHTAAATAAIVGGNLAVLTAALIGGLPRLTRLASACFGTVGFASAALLVWTDMPPGACERAAIYSIIGWQLLAGVVALSAACGKNLGKGSESH